MEHRLYCSRHGDYVKVDVENIKDRAKMRSECMLVANVIGGLPIESLSTTKPSDLVKAQWANRTLATRNRRLARLRSMTYFASSRPEVYGITSNPFQIGRVSISTDKEMRRYRRISRAEEHRLLTAARSSVMRVRLLGAFSMATRATEMVKIQAKAIDFDRCLIMLIGQTTKDGETRMVPFEPGGELEKALKARAFDESGTLRPHAYVFGNEDGSYLSHQGLKRQWLGLVLRAHGHHASCDKRGGYFDAATKTALRAIDLHWHDIRHEVASRWIERGINIVEIRNLLGHASVTTTQRYLHITAERMKTASMHKRLWGKRPAGGLRLVAEAVK